MTINSILMTRILKFKRLSRQDIHKWIKVYIWLAIISCFGYLLIMIVGFFFNPIDAILSTGDLSDWETFLVKADYSVTNIYMFLYSFVSVILVFGIKYLLEYIWVYRKKKLEQNTSI